MSHEPADSGQNPWLPPPDECEEQNFYAAVGELGDVEHFRMVRDLRDNLVDFAIIETTRYQGRSVQVAVADICHGQLHVHIYGKRAGGRVGREDIMACASQKDVDDCYITALDQIEEKWEDYKGRWNRG
jgi:hypothetical protein